MMDHVDEYNSTRAWVVCMCVSVCVHVFVCIEGCVYFHVVQHMAKACSMA